MMKNLNRRQKMWVKYNNNPAGRSVGDCAVRAVAKALGINWKQAFAKIVANAFQMCDMPSSNAVWGSVLMQNGFVRESLPNTCPYCYTAEDFCKDHPKGLFVLCFGNHVATVENGSLFDSWDSSSEIVQYIWRKESEQ